MIFLRPWALLALIVPFFIKGLQRLTRVQTPWAKFIDKALLPTLLIKSGTDKLKRLGQFEMWTLWIMWTLALAGPAFNKLPTPAVQSAPNTVIVFDLSMQGNQLLQGRAKLYDLLSALNGERVGLVVFGQNKGYTAMPMTPDIALIKEIVPTLAANVLPEPATNPTAGFEYAATLLDNAGQTGRILYVTDQVPKWSGRYPFGVLNLKERTADDQDIRKVLASTQKTEATTTDTTFSTSADVWADLGAWLVLFSLPFFAKMFRKGTLFLILLLTGFQAQAGFFWRPDQEAYRTEQKAIEAYHNKEYTTATTLFQQTKSFYNLGNALAYAGDIQGAIQAYQEELKRNPDNQDAQFNKEYLEKQLPPPKEQQKQNEDGKSQNNQNKSDENTDQNQQGENQEKEQQKDEEKTNSQTQNQSEKEQDSEKNQSENQPTQEETQKQLEQALTEYEKENPPNQEEQQIINRLNHDPSRVLRYRLLLQHQKGQMK